MKNLQNLFSIGLFSSIFFIPPLKADFDSWGYTTEYYAGTKFYTINSSTGEANLVSTVCDPNGACGSISEVEYNETTSKLEYKLKNKWYSYDLNTGVETEIEAPWASDYDNTGSLPKVFKSTDGTLRVQVGSDKLVTKNTDGSVQIGGDTDDVDVVSDGLNIDGSAVITKNADGSVQIGADGNDIDITAEGLNVNGNPLITQKENGEIHIGKNSLITTKEEKTLSDGRKVQPLYAEDADGNRIPINIDGTKLLIDGVEVTAGDSEQVTTNKNNISTNTSNISSNTSYIKNLGEGVAGSTALTAALSALPQTSKESKLSCGVGTGAYSSRYAVGFGCASKLNERVDVNAGGSYVFGGSKSYGGGTLDSGVVKAGFVFKLGELNKPNQISNNYKKLINKKISTLEENNKNLKAAIEESKAKNSEIISQNQKLLARLEKLENIALKFQSSSEMISVAKKE